MSKFPSFLEYLNDKGKIVDKPEVERVPDYHGPDDKTPQNSKVPYKTPLTPKAAQKGEKGFAELGDGKLVYEPNTDVNYETKKDVMKEFTVTKARTDAKCDYKGPFSSAPKGGKPYVAKAQKPGERPLGELGDSENKYEPDTNNAKPTKTESFLNKTRNMSLGQFTKYMLEECGCGQVSGEDMPYITAYSAGKIQPHPPEAIKYVTVLANKNDGILENLVSTIINMGYLGKLMKAVLEHPQAYEELTALLGDDKDGPSRCKSFAGAMSNSYSKFLSDQEGLYESVSSPIGFESEEDLEGEEDFGDEDPEGEEEFDDEEDLGDDDEEDLGDEGDEGLGDDEDFEDEEDEDLGDEDTEDEDELGPDRDDLEGMHDEEGSDHEESPSSEDEEPMHGERKLKKRFAHHHLLDAMKGHEHMFKAMRGV
jgi:hypothetical protein